MKSKNYDPASPLSYITEVIQRGRIKPAKYKHYLKMSREIYLELSNNNIIRPEDYFIEESVFFEYKEDIVILNFIHLYICDDLHIRILNYLLNKKYGYEVIFRGGTIF